MGSSDAQRPPATDPPATSAEPRTPEQQPDYVTELSRAMQDGPGEIAATQRAIGEQVTSAPADESQRGAERTFEPSPFGVPAPTAFVPTWARRPIAHEAEEPSPPVRDAASPHGAEPAAPEPQELHAPIEAEAIASPSAEPQAAPPAVTEPAAAAPVVAEPPRVVDPEPPPPSPPPPPPPGLRLEVGAGDDRHEPAFAPAASAAPWLHAPRSEERLLPATAPRQRWRELAGRAAHVAFLVFAGWFIAVLILILAYRFINPSFSMLMAQRWLGGAPITKEWVPLARISPNLARAVIVAEDGRFCSHWGVDFVEAANAIRRASDGYPRGASTITMQVAKNLFLVPAKSYLRKLVEIPLTFAIELAWPKRRILEIYLNIVEWGPGIFGAEAASRAHFGHPAATLTARQAAQLAAVLPNPIVRDAGDPGPRTARKASVIQARAARTREASACVDNRR